MTLDLTLNYFELFGLPVDFDIDLEALARRFRELQAASHPDKFANADDEQRRQAMQQTALINEASDTLRNSRLRARYLLTLKGVDLDDETDLSKDPGYLMQQMELRESIEDAESAAQPFDELDSLRKIVAHRRDEVESDFRAAWGKDALDDARQAVLKMRFCERVTEEIERIEARLEDELL